MYKKYRQQTIALMLTVILSATGCGVGTYRTDVTLNGTRKIEHKLEGITRRIETDAPVVFENGAIKTLPPGAVLRIQETKDSDTTRAELRENNGQQELFIEVGDSFRQSTPEEQAWFRDFLKAMELEDRDPSDFALTNLRDASSFSAALKTELEALNSSDKTELLKAVVKELQLTPTDQAAVVDATLDEVAFASKQTDILLALIERSDFAAEAEQKIRDRIDDISFSASRDKVTAALSRQSGGKESANSSAE